MGSKKKLVGFLVWFELVGWIDIRIWWIFFDWARFWGTIGVFVWLGVF
jgi:hypothetical protein